MNHDTKNISPIGSIGETQIGLLQVPPVAVQGRQGKPVDLKDAAIEFEAYFISHMLKVMRETVPKGALENKGGAYFYSFYDEEIGRLASAAGGLGLGKMIHEYMDKNAQPLKFSEPRTDIVVDKDHIPTPEKTSG